MGNEWRKRTYYKPRVLISTQRVLDPQFDDGLICLTGAELEMLRNLTQYLKRRSTFSEDETESGYLSPSTADWDSIQAIVANLEEKIMGCQELMAIFEDMLLAMQCVCNKQTAVPGLTPGTSPIVQEYLDDGSMVPGDVHAGDTVLEGDRCAVAQLVFWQSWSWLTEWIQPLQENTAEILMPAAMLAIAVMVGAPLLAVPGALILAFVWRLLEVWVDGSLQDVQNELWANQDELICAVWAGLAVDARAAETAAAAVIENISGLSPIDIIVFRAMYAPWAIALAERAHDNGTAWALANVTPGACDDCDWWWVRTWTFPPCPGDLVGDQPCSTYGRPSFNAAPVAVCEVGALPDILSNVDIHIEVEYKSCFGFGMTCGFVRIEYQDVGDDWHALSECTCTTLETAGTENFNESNSYDVAIPRNDLRLQIHGMGGQGQEDPWPFMVRWIRVTIMPHV